MMVIQEDFQTTLQKTKDLISKNKGKILASLGAAALAGGAYYGYRHGAFDKILNNDITNASEGDNTVKTSAPQPAPQPQHQAAQPEPQPQHQAPHKTEPSYLSELKKIPKPEENLSQTQLSNLGFKYRKNPAVENITLEIEAAGGDINDPQVLDMLKSNKILLTSVCQKMYGRSNCHIDSATNMLIPD